MLKDKPLIVLVGLMEVATFVLEDCFFALDDRALAVEDTCFELDCTPTFELDARPQTPNTG